MSARARAGSERVIYNSINYHSVYLLAIYYRACYLQHVYVLSIIFIYFFDLLSRDDRNG